ncbi:MAG: PfkB family carbohydrate kinase, partial [Defluviitaleaceae bacterium]|nr:PfkB family carbohydrate kinase [Defluviitaleaceae bacterium]
KTLCEKFIGMGVGTVALSMGAEGALFVSRDEALYAPGLKVNALSTVGAGDSLTGAFAYALDNGMPLRAAAALAVAASAGAVMTEGTKPPGRETVDKLAEDVVFRRVKGDSPCRGLGRIAPRS